MVVLAIIGDLVESRALADRRQVQRHLEGSLQSVNAAGQGIASPYTLTLGDEFQAVLRDGRRALPDAVRIQAAVHPVMVRFSMAVGALTTDINPRQALGMDGPAFHQARDAIDSMKASDATLFHVSGLHEDCGALCNASLSLISHAFGKWQTRRFQILAALQQGAAVPDIARRFNVSEQAVYKNISDGRLKDVLAAFDAIGRLMNHALAH